jgi:two-component sensor histidine kinase
MEKFIIRISILICLLAMNTCVYGDGNLQIDSLQKQIQLKKKRVECYLKLSKIYLEDDNHDKALEYLESAKAIATIKEMSLVYNKIGKFYLQTNNSEKAIENLMLSYKYLQKNYDEELSLNLFTNLAEVNIVMYKHKKALSFIFTIDSILAIGNNKIKYADVVIDNNFRKGCIYKKYGLHEMAMEINFDNIKILEPINGNCSAEYLELGNIKNRLKDMASSIVYFKKSAEVAIRCKDNYNAHTSLNSLALIYMIKKKFDSASLYLNNAKLYYKPNDSLRLFETAFLDAKISMEKKDYQEAIRKYNYASSLWDIESSTGLMCSYFLEKSDVYIALKYYGSAKLEVLHAIKVGKGVDDLEVMRANYLKLGQIEFLLQNYKSSIIANKIADSLNAILFEDVKTKAVIASEIKYETTIKEATISKQQAQLKTKHQQNIFLTIGLFCLGFVAAGLAWLYRKIKNKNAIIQLQKHEILHNIENNLGQMIVIFEQQSRIPGNEKNALENQERMLTLSTLNKMLYDNEKKGEVNIQAYLAKLCEAKKISTGNKIEFQLQISNTDLKINLAKDIGLIVNELSMNAIKYAFANTEKPSIYIEVVDEITKIKVVVHDNGIGIPEKIIAKMGGGFGMQYVGKLVDGHKGVLKVLNNGGARFVMELHKK